MKNRAKYLSMSLHKSSGVYRGFTLDGHKLLEISKITRTLNTFTERIEITELPLQIYKLYIFKTMSNQTKTISQTRDTNPIVKKKFPRETSNS